MALVCVWGGGGGGRTLGGVEDPRMCVWGEGRPRALGLYLTFLTVSVAEPLRHWIKRVFRLH